MTVSDFHKMAGDTLRLNPGLGGAPLFADNGGEVSGIGIGGGEGVAVMHECRPKIEQKSSEQYFRSVLTLAGFDALSAHQIANGYWPASYLLLRAENPWWLFETKHGLIKIGWRKRVISIEWSFVRVVPTKDDVTKDENMVHAYTPEKAIEYLRAIRLASEENGDTP